MKRICRFFEYSSNDMESRYLTYSPLNNLILYKCRITQKRNAANFTLPFYFNSSNEMVKAFEEYYQDLEDKI